jgi:hypothetical protein
MTPKHLIISIGLLIPAVLLPLASCNDSKALNEPAVDRPSGTAGPSFVVSSPGGSAIHNPRSQAGQKVRTFDGTRDGGCTGSASRFGATEDGAELRTDGAPCSYAGTYPVTQTIRGKRLTEVSELAFSYAGGPPRGGSPRLSIAIDENGDGVKANDPAEQYAFIAINRCNDGDPELVTAEAFVGTVDGEDDATCLIDHKGVEYANWNAFQTAHPTWRVAREDAAGNDTFTFIVQDQGPSHYLIWKVDVR